MKNYIQKGEAIEVTTPAGGYTAGQLVTVGEIVGVAQNTTLENETAVISLAGVYNVAKATGAITQGAKCYLDAVAGNITTTATGNKLAGYAWLAAASGDATVQVKFLF